MFFMNKQWQQSLYTKNIRQAVLTGGNNMKA